MASIGPGISCTRSLGRVGGLAMWQWIHSRGSEAVNGSDPVPVFPHLSWQFE
jgi:hypothetical protein